MSARKKALALAAQQPTPAAADASAPLMHVATQIVPAPAELPTPDQEETQAPEVEQASPLTVATDEALAEQPAAPAAEQPAPAPLAPFTPELPVRAPRSLDEILEVVGKAKSLTERLTAYKATGEKLGSFTLGRETLSDRLTIRDGNGQEWNTTQSVIIQKVLDVLRGELRAATNATEDELRQVLQAA